MSDMDDERRRETAKIRKMAEIQSAIHIAQHINRIQMSIGEWYMDADGCLTREIKNVAEK